MPCIGSTALHMVQAFQDSSELFLLIGLFARRCAAACVGAQQGPDGFRVALAGSLRQGRAAILALVSASALLRAGLGAPSQT